MALDKKLLAKLNKAKGAWGKAKTRAATQGDFPEFNDGSYLVRFVDAEMGEAKSSGRLQLIKSFKFVEGEYKGQVKKAYDGLETEDNLVYVARDVSRFGYEAPEDLGDLLELFQQIAKEKPLVKVRIKTNGDFQNVYIDAVYDKDEEDEALENAAGDEDVDAEAEEGVEEEGAEEESGEEEATEEEGVEEEVAEEDDTQELAVGTKVMATISGKVQVGDVIEIIDAEEKVRFRTAEGKVFKVAIDKLEAPPDEEEAEADAEEEEPEVPAAPAKKPAAAKKPAPAPAPAPKKVLKKK